jgi:hypothetical protein
VNAPPLVRDRPATSTRKRPARRRPVVVDVLAAAAGLGLGISIALAVTDASTVATGAPITTEFGTTQVKVTIANGRITDVAAIQPRYRHCARRC